MSEAFGIHLGNSSACLALNSNGAPMVIANDSGDRVTPAVLALNGAEWEIGLPAKSGQARSKATVTNNKRLMNIDWNDDDLLCVENSSTCKIINDERLVKYEFTSNDNTLYSSPDDIATKMYAKLFTIASHSVRSDGDLKIVLAAPLHWSSSSRYRIVKSAELAGFDVLQVISEAAASLLAYNITEMSEEGDINVLVYRLGGTSCDASIVKVSGGFLTVEKNIHRSDLGGQCLTRDLADYIAQEFRQKWKLDPKESRRAMVKLFHHADSCKHVLSTLSSAHVFIESLLDGVDWSQNVTRARFENIISSKLSSYMEPIQNVIEQFGGKVDKIVLCGGSMKIPKLQTAVVNLLPDAMLLSGISPDEVIAEGCSRQAGYLLDMPELSLIELNLETNFLSKNIFMRYLDKTILVFKEGSPVHSQATYNVENSENVKAMDVTLHNDPEEEYFAIETFDTENLCSPYTLKATLQHDKILLEVE